MSNTVSRIISDDTLSCAIQIESAGNPLAKAPTSSALGLGQFLNATWLEVVRRHRPYWLSGRSEAQVLALRKEPNCTIEMLARHWEDNGKAMGSYVARDLYLVFSQAAINSNRSALEGKTCGQVRTWAASKMAKASGCNWVAVYMAGAKPSAPPAVKKTVAASTASAAATATTAAQQGWSTDQLLLAVGITLIVCGAIGAAAYFWPRKAPVKIEGERTMDFDWKPLAGAVIRAGAPIIGGALAGPLGSAGGGMLGGLLANALGVVPTLEAVGNAIATGDPAVVSEALARADSAAVAKWSAIEGIARSMADVDKTVIEQINATIREEMRPGAVKWWHSRHLLGYAVLA